MTKQYPNNSQTEVKNAMHEYKHHDTFKNRKQAIAVGLSKARRKSQR